MAFIAYAEIMGQIDDMFATITWITQNQVLLTNINPILTGGEIKTSTLRVQLTEEYTSGVSIRCVAVTHSPASDTSSNTSATLTAYGKYMFAEYWSGLILFSTGHPQSPSGLTTELIQVDTLTFSWSAPPSPPTVQLNYTVTVTNTNTSVVRNFTTSNTTITLTRGDVEGDGECDEYVWSVTAVNLAGASHSANHSTPVSLGIYTP